MSDGAVMKATRVFKNIHESFNYEYKPTDPQYTYVLEGSSGSSKTTSIIQLLINYCQFNNEKRKKITAARAKYSWTKDSILKDFIEKIIEYGLYREENHKRSHPQQYTLFGNVISFIGLDDPQRFHGPRQDITWINEAMEADQDSYTQLAIRTNEAMILDYNPSYTVHWIFNTILRNWKNKPEVFYWHSTFKDNQYLPRGQRDNILKLEPTPENIENGTADDYKWQVYGLGMRAVQEGLIYKHVTYIESFPDNLTYWYGMDYGFTNDPLALVKIAIDGNDMYLEKKIYEPIDNPDLVSDALVNAGVKKQDLIAADSADKFNDMAFTSDLQDLGWGIEGISKTKGIVYWIGQVKKYKLHIVEDNDFRVEQENYKWKTIGGMATNQPIDAHNHIFDAIRYGIMLNNIDRDAFW